MKRAYFVSFALFVTLTGCGSSDEPPAGVYAKTLKRYPVPGCESFDPAPCDVLTGACQERLLGLAACLRGSDAGESLPVSVLAEERFRYELQDQAEAEGPSPHLERWDAAFSKLGLIEPGAFSAESRVEEAVAAVLAYYSPESKSIVLIDHGDGADKAQASVTLLHEYVHALQDREVDLRSFEDTEASSFEADNAFDSLVEGEARFHELHFAASAFGFDPAAVDWDALFENSVEGNEAWIFEQASVLVAGQRAFPYVWGSRYLHHTWAESGHAGILDRYASPMVSTRALLASQDQAVTDDFSPTVLEPPMAPSEYELIGVDTLGGFGAFLLFGLAGPSAARSLADGWRGDTLSVYASSNPSIGGTIVVWSADFATADVAQRALVNLANQFSMTFVARVDTRVTLALSTNAALPLDWAFASPDP